MPRVIVTKCYITIDAIKVGDIIQSKTNDLTYLVIGNRTCLRHYRVVRLNDGITGIISYCDIIRNFHKLNNPKLHLKYSSITPIKTR